MYTPLVSEGTDIYGKTLYFLGVYFFLRYSEGIYRKGLKREGLVCVRERVHAVKIYVANCVIIV